METFAAFAFLLSVIAAISAFAAYAYSSYTLKRYLQHKHPDVWAKIAPVPNALPSVSSPFGRFITQRTYNTMADPQLSSLGNRCRWLLYLAVTAGLVLILSGLAYDALTA